MDSIPSFKYIEACQDDLQALLLEYGTQLAPRIVEYEVEQCEFPVEVLNEIRSIYAHLYRASVAIDINDAIGNITKAKSHSKRAILDCYKYLCVTYDERYHGFFKKFNYINWSKSGFIKEIGQIDQKRASAVELLRRAKVQESTEAKSGNPDANDTEDYRDLYKKAYEAYYELNQLLLTFEGKIIEGHSIVARFPMQWVLLFGLGGCIVGYILGLLL